MSDPIISAEEVGKSYLVGHQSADRERYTALRDVIGLHARRFARKTIDMMRGRQIIQGDEVEEFWALKDITFDVAEGEVVGIIGRNGAGKSTLLKVFSRITEPTKGCVTLRGRVASLLEVGTGFHPELTGRENIFLNGAILGMTRQEIKRKFDEIVEFAGVNKFLDTPVKRYSSGMYVRLAFAVAAHLDPEILVVDEVLAVGDSEFQKKCLGKMKDVAQSGRTVLFVSHNMGAIRTLTNRTVVLQKGTVSYVGETSDALEWYLNDVDSADLSDQGDYVVEDPSRLLASMSIESKGMKTRTIAMGDPLMIRLRFRSTLASNRNTIGVVIEDKFNQRVCCLSTIHERSFLHQDTQYQAITCSVAELPLNQGRYFISIMVADESGRLMETHPQIAEFSVDPADVFQTGAILMPQQGLIWIPSVWATTADDMGGG